MNKYRDESREAQEARRRQNMCGRKRAFATMNTARQPGQGAYKCPYCGMFHRTGSLAQLAAQVKRRRQ